MIEVSSIGALKEAGFERISLACGNFDGLHRGHQEIINTLLAASTKHDSTPVVLTFVPHPREVLTGMSIPALTSSHTKKRLLAAMGIEALVSIPFNKEFASRRAEDFVREIFLCNGLNVLDVCIGSKWRFGKDREGDVAFLNQSQWPFEVYAVEEVVDRDEHISSSRVRCALAEGDFSLANNLLGREYSVFGSIVKGRGIASAELHFPTANVNVLEQCLPLAGVFACRISIADSINWLPAVCNIGYAPTFGENHEEPARVEVHIMDFKENIYSKNVEVAFVKFIRKESKFSSVQLLKEQIAKDVNEARIILSTQ